MHAPLPRRQPEAIGFSDAELIALLPTMMSAAVYLTRSDEKARDLVQETATRMMTYKHTFYPDRPGSMLIKWAMRIMRNIWISWIRHTTRIQLVSLEQPSLTPLDPMAPDDQDMVLLYKEFNERAYSKLHKRFKDVIELMVIEGLSDRQVGLRLGIPEGTVKSRLHRARKYMREYNFEDA